jgi:hypothetical protein
MTKFTSQCRRTTSTTGASNHSQRPPQIPPFLKLQPMCNLSAPSAASPSPESSPRCQASHSNVASLATTRPAILQLPPLQLFQHQLRSSLPKANSRKQYLMLRMPEEGKAHSEYNAFSIAVENIKFYRTYLAPIPLKTDCAPAISILEPSSSRTSRDKILLPVLS